MAHPILQKLLRQLGIESFDKLDNEPNPDNSPTERQKFEEWDRILSLPNEVTIPDLKKFLKSEIEKIEMKWRSLEIENAKKAEWITAHTIYKTILLAIDSPKSVRESLERELLQKTK